MRVEGAGCRVQVAGCRVQGSGCRVQGAGRTSSEEKVASERVMVFTAPE